MVLFKKKKKKKTEFARLFMFQYPYNLTNLTDSTNLSGKSLITFFLLMLLHIVSKICIYGLL